jgi:hypothetical protein
MTEDWEWYVLRDGEVLGPIETEQLQEMLPTLSPTDSIRSEVGEWAKLNSEEFMFYYGHLRKPKKKKQKRPKGK